MVSQTMSKGPMGLGQLRDYLEQYFGIPIGLRRLGTSEVICPFCDEIHGTDVLSGHQEAGCDPNIRDNIEIYINDRRFIVNYGMTVIDYKEDGKGVKEVIIPPNLE